MRYGRAWQARRLRLLPQRLKRSMQLVGHGEHYRKFVIDIGTIGKHIRAVSGRVESEGDSRIDGNLIDDLRRLEAARDGSVVFGFTQEGDFGGN